MRKIIDVITKEEVGFGAGNLPMFIHGREHSGASLLSITIATSFHANGDKLCMFTAYPMAREEFMQQVNDPENVFYLEDEKSIIEASKFKTVTIESGNLELFIKYISDESFEKDRIVFVKNIETINIPICELLKKYPFFISGDLDLNKSQAEFKNLNYNTKIFLSTLEGEQIKPLEKYQAYMRSNSGDRIISMN